jgi:uncharacterized membrane protein YfcA
MSTLQWSLIILSSFLIGFSKTGVGGFLLPVIPIMAAVFGGMSSTGILLPLLLAGDVIALYYYKKHGNWDDLRKILPWAFAGLALGAVVGNYIDDRQFKTIISFSIILCLALLIYSEKKGGELQLPNRLWFCAFVGLTAGFTSMIGNAAGPVFTLYLLSRGVEKTEFMGTTTWFFFIINLTKLPLQIFFWQNISLSTLSTDLLMLPAIAAGAFVGIKVFKLLNENLFRIVVIVMTAVSALRLLM